MTNEKKEEQRRAKETESERKRASQRDINVINSLASQLTIIDYCFAFGIAFALLQINFNVFWLAVFRFPFFFQH